MRRGFDPFSARILWRVAAAGFGISVVFLLEPDIDRWISGLLSTPETGFFWAQHPIGLLVRDLVIISMLAIVGAAVLSLLAKALAPRPTPLLRITTSVYLLATLVLVPGVLVNLVLKDNWGRPRPVHLVEFQDPPSWPVEVAFQPVWVISNQCPSNCSFVSGEASAGFVVVALVPLAAARYRRAALASALGWGAIVAAARVVQGGHFFSDVVLAGILTYIAVGLLHRLLRADPPTALSEQACRDRLMRWRAMLARRWRHHGLI